MPAKPIHTFIRSLKILGSLSIPIFMTACAAEITRYPSTLQAIEANINSQKMLVRQDTPVTFNSGYERVIRKNTVWKPVGSVTQGTVYAAVDNVFSVEGAHVHEAYLVVNKGNLIGFYLPAERSFTPLNSINTINLWENQ